MSHVILVLEDDLLIQKLIKRMIKRAGFTGEIEVFSESSDALSYLESNRDCVRLALLDTMIHPEGDEALAYALLERAPHLHIVASSGHSEADLRGPNHFGAAPLTGVLTKPFGLGEIKTLLGELQLIET